MNVTAGGIWVITPIFTRTVYSNIYPTRFNVTQFIYVWKLLYMLRVVSPPIIRSTHNCIYSIWYLSNHWSWNRVPTLPRQRQESVTVWQVPDAVDTVVCAPDGGWKYHTKHVEQFPDINKHCNVASTWIYIGIYLRRTDPWTLNWQEHFELSPIFQNNRYVLEALCFRSFRNVDVENCAPLIILQQWWQWK